jgi:16S rRNA (cytidine1402-2'-O)-methyltransferase
LTVFINVKSNVGELVLIPVDLGSEKAGEWVGPQLRKRVLSLRHFVAESPKSARHFLKALGLPVQELKIDTLDEHSTPADARQLATQLSAGVDLGLLSDAGCPAVADPGAWLVAEAHRIGAKVLPLVGPSSILLALMASGLNGQRFAFHGYLPARSPDREAAIRQLEERSRRAHETQIMIETPYRNAPLLGALLATCSKDTLLCLASNLTEESEDIRTASIGQWRSSPPDLARRPAVFLLLAGGNAVSAPRSAHHGPRRRRTH